MLSEKVFKRMQKMDKAIIDEIARLDEDEFELLKRASVAIKVIDRLKEIIKAIETRDLTSIEKYISFSSSGNGYGYENYYIDFSDITKMEDIGEVLKYLDIEKRLNL